MHREFHVNRMRDVVNSFRQQQQHKREVDMAYLERSIQVDSGKLRDYELARAEEREQSDAAWDKYKPKKRGKKTSAS